MSSGLKRVKPAFETGKRLGGLGSTASFVVSKDVLRGEQYASALKLLNCALRMMLVESREPAAKWIGDDKVRSSP